MTRTWDDINKAGQGGLESGDHAVRGGCTDRRTDPDGRSAAEIADRALVSEPTARRHCKSLVNTGFAETDQDGQTTLYRRDSDRILMSRIRELRGEVHSAGVA